MKEPNLIIENLKAILEECTASEDAVSYVNSEDAGTLKAAIEALEKQEQDRWIPVTERLPEIKHHIDDEHFSDEVLVTEWFNGFEKTRIGALTLAQVGGITKKGVDFWA